MMAEWMTMLARVCSKERRVSEDCHWACVITIYKGMGECSECKHLKGINMLSIPGQVFG